MRWLGVAARVTAGAVAIGRLAGAARAEPPIARAAQRTGTISVVIPARDEAQRLGPLLDAIVGAPGVDQVLDEQSIGIMIIPEGLGGEKPLAAPVQTWYQ